MEASNARHPAAMCRVACHRDVAGARRAWRNESLRPRLDRAEAAGYADTRRLAGWHRRLDRPRRADGCRAWMGSDVARHWIIITSAVVFGSAALGNAWALRGRHVGWVAMSAVVALAFAGY